jgi:hypothetical protein
MRFSDIRLQYAGKAPETWLDKHEVKILNFEKKEKRFDEKEKGINN